MKIEIEIKAIIHLSKLLVLSPTLRFKEINPDIDFEITVIVRKRIFCAIAKRDIGI